MVTWEGYYGIFDVVQNANNKQETNSYDKNPF
jgi:hypothetical protein